MSIHLGKYGIPSGQIRNAFFFFATIVKFNNKHKVEKNDRKYIIKILICGREYYREYNVFPGYNK